MRLAVSVGGLNNYWRSVQTRGEMGRVGDWKGIMYVGLLNDVVCVVSEDWLVWNSAPRGGAGANARCKRDALCRLVSENLSESNI